MLQEQDEKRVQREAKNKGNEKNLKKKGWTQKEKIE